MKKAYEVYGCVTRKILDSIKIGDLVKCNDWVKPMRVITVSDNYILMTRNHFGEIMYSVIEKKECGFNHNDMTKGMFHCGTDNLIFGPCVDFANEEECSAFLQDFESGNIEMSVRRSVVLRGFQIKRLNTTREEFENV